MNKFIRLIKKPFTKKEQRRLDREEKQKLEHSYPNLHKIRK